MVRPLYVGEGRSSSLPSNETRRHSEPDPSLPVFTTSRSSPFYSSPPSLHGDGPRVPGCVTVHVLLHPPIPRSNFSGRDGPNLRNRNKTSVRHPFLVLFSEQGNKGIGRKNTKETMVYPGKSMMGPYDFKV